LLNQLKPN